MRLIMIGLLALSVPAAAQEAKSMSGRITGIGGVFFKAKDPKALADWYRDKLGMKIEDWGGAVLMYDKEPSPPYGVWGPFKADTKYFEPSTRDYMINLTVDDLDAMIAKLKTKGVEITGREDSEQGRFAWIVDPEGTKIELWEPKKP